MRRRRAITVLGCACGLLVGLFTTSALRAEEGDEAPVSLHGIVDLQPPEGAANPDAAGLVYLREMADHAAIHVHVRGLEPGAAYDVIVTSGDASESIGTITTHDGEAPPPRHFHARLASADCESAPEGGDPGDDPGDDPGEDPAAGGEGGWFRHGCGEEGGTGDRMGWMDRLRELLEGFRSHRGFFQPDCPRGHASLVVNREKTEVYYQIHVIGLAADVTSATLRVGEGDAATTIDLDAETLRGTIEATDELLAALAEGTVSAVVEAGEESIEGVLEARFSKLGQRISAMLAGRGSLRIDTARGDELPLGAASIADLVGAGIAVVEAENADNAVLVGVVGELMEGRRCWWRHGDDAGTAPEDPADPDEAAGEAAFFEVGEPHDASFTRGDANDDGVVDLSDPVFLLSHLFLGGDAPYCADAADANDDGAIEMTDAIVMLQSLFQGGAGIPAPYPLRGFDSTADALSCQ